MTFVLRHPVCHWSKSCASSHYHLKGLHKYKSLLVSHDKRARLRSLLPTARSSASGSTSTTEVPHPAMPESELEQEAQRVRQLEAEAIAMHDLAQRLNKEGRFEEAQAAYAAMHRLEDEASELAARVGCVACVLGDPEQPAGEQPSLCNLDPAVLMPYEELHPVLPWRRAASQGSDSQRLTAAGLEARAVGCILGSALADAAAMGVHWVYDLAVLDEIEQARRQQAASAAGSASPASLAHPDDFGLEFTEPPRSPFYSYGSGRNSPYGEQTLVLLRSLAEGSGAGSGTGGGAGLHCGHYAALFAREFGPESGFDGYRDVSTKGFLRNYARGIPPPLSGANDAQANCIARLAPLVSAFADAPARTRQQQQQQEPGTAGGGSAAGGGDGDVLLRCVDLATRVTQNTDAAVAWATAGALILERILLGSSAEAAVRHVVNDLESPDGRAAPYAGVLASEIAARLTRVLELRTTRVPEAVAELGRNCHMPNALQTPLHVVLHVEHLVRHDAVATAGATGEVVAESTSRTTAATGGDASGHTADRDPRVAALPVDSYVWGVRLAVREGGCCASRAAYVGACLGAMVARPGGTLGLPESWLAQYLAAGRVRAWADAIVAAKRGR